MSIHVETKDTVIRLLLGKNGEKDLNARLAL
jgi:hypothetical protein